MPYALVVPEAILVLPVAATLAFCLAYRIRRRKWPMPPFWAIGVAVACNGALFILMYYQFQTGQSSPSDTAVGTRLFIGSLAGIGALFLVVAAAARTKMREREK